ncbi:MAG: TetR/AcrR family transcriptional regulator [Ktedonobacteraceae bacterium]|nr:TetR/AcrR family transcriptional regulator [Ktedonobacteraceae bacterium]MBV9709612.1 TetR/AcrR family transcriptional regulator [Ktedonobacteraceae bacterium]
MSEPVERGEEVEENNKRIVRARTAHADERRRSLVLAAYDLIAEKGFEDLRTRDVAARAGVNIATLHYYFASKEDLIDGVVDYLLDLFSSEASRDLEMDFSTPLGHLRAMFSNTAYRMRTMPRMFVVLGELVMRSQRNPELGAAMDRMDAQWMHYLNWIVTEGIAQGQFRADLDSEATAKKIIVIVKGVTFQYVWTQKEVDFEGILQILEWLVLPEHYS